ncbi:uncharacterized protein LOC129222042 isoform X2 [Uloborus diversus]|uniref:uncharacterized protein LOC129222042 isoform X2 n=1 Tax=Uloborus diversus TaxID=327109 RepID=UPI002409425B|nr:uncharacterized protein LOC129222042 isoform X2 [Uloborus diversus]
MQKVDKAAEDLVPNQPTKEVNVLIEEAESAIDTFNYDEADSKLTEVLKINPDDTKALEMLASVYIEQCKWFEVENLLKHCIEIAPSVGYSKFFSMAQLCNGKEALENYLKGVEIIEKELENVENILPSEEKNKPSLQRNLSDAYCSIAEIYMTDCCDEENAEENCANAINYAMKVDPSNPDAYQCFAGFHLIRERLEEAKEAIQKSLSLWLPQHEAMRDGESNEMEIVLPGQDSRTKTSKILIEVEMFEEATTILEGLLAENDENVEFWYLLGLANYMHGEEYKYNAHYYFQKAKEIGTKFGFEDEEMEPQVDDFIEELRKDYPLDEEDEQDSKEAEFDSSSDSQDEMET